MAASSLISLAAFSLWFFSSSWDETFIAFIQYLLPFSTQRMLTGYGIKWRDKTELKTLLSSCCALLILRSAKAERDEVDAQLQGLFSTHTSPRNRFTAESSSVLEENKGGALGIGIILSFSPPSATPFPPPTDGKPSYPFTKGSEVPPDLTAVRFLAPLISSSTMPPSGRVKVLVFLPFRKLFFTEEETHSLKTHQRSLLILAQKG